ncbi:SRPBCC family protein [Fulvivirga kasyanovii]
MSTTEKTNITVKAIVNAPIEKVWKLWTTPEDIIQWNSASDDWHTPSATNDLRVGGRFTSRMEAKDGSMGFDFGGVYDEVKTNAKIRYTMDDDRKVSILFKEENGKTRVTETFEAEGENSVEMQRDGWQAILDNFKKYAEAKGK